MAPKQSKQETLPVSDATPTPKVEAVTYYAKTDGKAWEVRKVEVLADGSYRATKVVGPCSLLIARDRMRVLLSSPEVMP